MEASLIGPLGRTMLGSTRVTIGRAADNTLVISDPKVSSHHAEIQPEGQYYRIVDLGSSNGTFVNDQQVYSGAPRLLQSGNTIRIGDTKFSFEATPSQTGAPSSDSTTLRATPSSPGGVIANFGSNTSYGGSGADYPNIQSDYQATLGAQQPSYPPPYTMANQQLPYTPSPPPYMMPESQMPTYTPSYGQPNQPPAYTPQSPPYMPSEPPAYQPQPQPPQRQGSIARTIILAVIALVIILGAGGAFFVVHNNQVAQHNINATATAQANINAHATATANAHATATAAVNATATAVVTSHYPPFTNVALYDPLMSNNSQWDTGSECQFTSAGYQVSIAQVGYFQWCLNRTQKLGELAYQATMNIQQGDCGGLLFRYVDSNNFYLLEVCQNGTYNIGDFVGGKASYLYPNARSSSAIHQGLNLPNVIAVTVQGDTLNMYVNGQRIDTATSTALTSSTFNQGQIGLLADDRTDPTSVTYTNVLTWTAS